MSNSFRVNRTVTTLQTVINEILAMAIASGPGPAWVQDATFTAAGNPGNLFLRSSGSTQMFVFFKSVSYHSQTVLQCFWVPATANGFGGSAGPLLHQTAPGCFLYLKTGYTHVLDLFFSEDRGVVVLRSTREAGGIPESGPEVMYQTLYFGKYTSHAASGDDTYPLVVTGNAMHAVDAPTAGEEFGYFPESMVKRVGPGNILLAQERGVAWNVRLDHSFVPPRNSRGGEAFAYQQDVYVRVPGAEESFSLTDVALSTHDHGLLADITVSAATYYTIPSMLHGVSSEPGSYGALLIVPKGTVVP